MTTFQALQTSLDYDDLLDLLEMRRARDSWKHAAMFDADEGRGA